MIKHEPVEIAEGIVVQNRLLTSQEEMLLYDRRTTVAMVDDAGDKLDGKALGLLQAASLVLALVAVLGLSDRLSGLAGSALTGLIVALLAFASMIAFAVVAWWPRSYFAVGTMDWDEMWAKCLLADTTSVYLQAISNYDELIRLFTARNRTKGVALSASGILFIVQIGGLLVLALAG